MNIPFVDLKAQYQAIGGEIDAAVRGVMESAAFINGPYVKRFEQGFAEYCEADHCVGVGNGTDALFLALKAFGVGPGDEVLVPAMTFVATAEAVSMTGASPVFVDVEPETHTMDPEDAVRKLTGRTRAVMPVHLYGHPANMPAIKSFARDRGLSVIQDAAQAHGATMDGQALSCFGDCCCYSFYPGKNLGAYGDAGGVVTNNGTVAEHVRKLANHGRTAKYDHDFPGVNSRMDSIQAAILSVKLGHLDRWTESRRHIAGVYDSMLGDAKGIVAPLCRKGSGHVYHLYVIRCDDRDGLKTHLAGQGISSGIHYPTAVPFLPAYAGLGHVPEDFPVAHSLQQSVLSLPMYPEMTAEQVEYVCGAVVQWENRAKNTM